MKIFPCLQYILKAFKKSVHGSKFLSYCTAICATCTKLIFIKNITLIDVKQSVQPNGEKYILTLQGNCYGPASLSNC